MSHNTFSSRFGLPLVLVAVLCTGGAREAAAQGFVSGSFGYAFGGDAGCPGITDCDDKNWNYGFSLGALGSILGFELEFMYAPEFFGEAPGQDSNLLALTGNFMLAPRFGAVQPYGLAGIGLIRTSVENSVEGLLESDNNQLGWDLGGGLMIFFGEHVGVRGDVRYYHSFEALDLLGIDFGDLVDGESKVDFGRFSGGVVLRF
jgi:opacity protein-like surface antigen